MGIPHFQDAKVGSRSHRESGGLVDPWGGLKKRRTAPKAPQPASSRERGQPALPHVDRSSSRGRFCAAGTSGGLCPPSCMHSRPRRRRDVPGMGRLSRSPREERMTVLLPKELPESDRENTHGPRVAGGVVATHTGVLPGTRREVGRGRGRSRGKGFPEGATLES